MYTVLVEADLLAPFDFDQRATDQQGIMQHELQCGICIEFFGNDLAGFYARRCAIETVGDGMVAKEFKQTFWRPRLSEQVLCDDFVACGRQQRQV